MIDPDKPVSDMTPAEACDAMTREAQAAGLYDARATPAASPATDAPVADGPIRLRFTPPADPDGHQPEEVAVVGRPSPIGDGMGDLLVYAKWRGQWHANAGERYAVRHLLDRLAEAERERWHQWQRARDAAALFYGARQVVRVMEAACGLTDAGDACRRVLATGRAWRERAEVPDEWVRVTDDQASLPPAWEYVVAWDHNGCGEFVRWSDKLGAWLDDDNVPVKRDNFVAWRREAGPGWLKTQT